MDYIIMGNAYGQPQSLYQNFDALDNLRRVCDRNAMLILLGDFIDFGISESIRTLQEAWNISYLDNVVALRGDREDTFQAFLDGTDDEWISRDVELKVSLGFLTSEQAEEVKLEASHGEMKKTANLVRAFILNNHPKIVQWLRDLPYYYETDRQIFVHAGIEEEAGQQWKEKTPTCWFTAKPFAAQGKFYKDIIASHFSTAALTRNPEYHYTLWDGQSHYYINDDVKCSGKIPILIYEDLTQEYRMFYGRYSTHGIEGRSWDA